MLPTFSIFQFARAPSPLPALACQITNHGAKRGTVGMTYVTVERECNWITLISTGTLINDDKPSVWLGARLCSSGRHSRVVGAGQPLLLMYTIERRKITVTARCIRHKRRNNFFSYPNHERHVENARCQKMENKKRKKKDIPLSGAS